MKKGTLVEFEKLSDDYFNGNHPNNINTGHTHRGVLARDITVGERAALVGKSVFDFFSTSVVTKILSDTTFKTLYSTYKVTELKD